MGSNTLVPPNHWWLSDQIVGIVATGSKRGPRPEVGDASSDGNTSRITQASADSATDLNQTAASRPKRSTSERSEGDTEQQLVFYRERRRVIQQQYRQRLRERGIALEQNVERLRGELKRLDQHRDRLCAEVSTKTTPWNVVAEYFRLFRNGFEPSEPLHNTAMTVDPSAFSRQKQFLRVTMAPNVVVQTGLGVDSLLTIWRAISHRHEDLEVELVRLEYDEVGALVATIKCHFTVTGTMLSQEFPHLFSEDGELPSLAAKLLGHRIVLPSAVRFEWNNIMGCMVCVTGRQFKNEMLGPFLKLVGSLEDLAFVLGGDIPSSE